MKKSFTLIEFMVAILLGLVVLNFIFSYQFSFFKEMSYQKAKENLSRKSYLIMEIVTKGLKNDNLYIPGMISTKSLQGRNEFRQHGSNYKWKISNTNNKFEFDNYIYHSLRINGDVELNRLKDKDNQNIKMYSIKVDTEIEQENQITNIDNPKYSKYTRLVYAR